MAPYFAYSRIVTPHSRCIFEVFGNKTFIATCQYILCVSQFTMCASINYHARNLTVLNVGNGWSFEMRTGLKQLYFTLKHDMRKYKKLEFPDHRVSRAISARLTEPSEPAARPMRWVRYEIMLRGTSVR